MVRTQGKQTSEDKKEGKKKSSNGSTKKKPETGSWPCKMDGCKKVFAREADLKRHQRTTKMHSIPGLYVLHLGFALINQVDQCPQCDATFTRTDALRRHQKSRHNGVVIEPAEENDKPLGDGASSGSRSPSPVGTPTRSHGEGSMNGSPPAAQSSNAGASSGPLSYYRPHTMQDGGGYYAGYPPPPRPPPPGMMMEHYPPPPIGLPTSATRSHQANWQPGPPAPPWGPEGHPMPPPPGMFVPSYYPSPYYRHPGMPIPPHPGHFPPQINPDLLAQSNGQMSGVTPPESALRDTSPDKPESISPGRQEQSQTGLAELSAAVDAREGESLRTTQGAPPPAQNGSDEGPDASTLMAAAALQAVLAFQKEQEIRQAAGQRASSAPDSASQTQLPPQGQSSSTAGPATEGTLSQPSGDQGAGVSTNGSFDADSDADGEPENANTHSVEKSSIKPGIKEDVEMEDTPTHTGPTNSNVRVAAEPSVGSLEVKQGDAGAPPQPMERLLTEDGTPMLSPGKHSLLFCWGMFLIACFVQQSS
ncbi:hypothetical protein C8Q79DRAFT_997646 [Trametes meyenii]|nr:hypothetical protein C8Q79DRAFT_997646 [Trametes meyenii]